MDYINSYLLRTLSLEFTIDSFLLGEFSKENIQNRIKKDELDVLGGLIDKVIRFFLLILSSRMYGNLSTSKDVLLNAHEDVLVVLLCVKFDKNYVMEWKLSKNDFFFQICCKKLFLHNVNTHWERKTWNYLHFFYP